MCYLGAGLVLRYAVRPFPDPYIDDLPMSRALAQAGFGGAGNRRGDAMNSGRRAARPHRGIPGHARTSGGVPRLPADSVGYAWPASDHQ
jgi:hypothetical protein